jgi:hypothetical protein
MSKESQEPVAPDEPAAMAVVFVLYLVVLAIGITAAIVIGLSHN